MFKNKIIVVLVFIVFFLAFSCKKEAEDHDIYISGITHLDTKVYDTVVLNLRISGKAEKISLSLKNVPKGVSYSFSPSQGSNDFSTSLVLIVTDKVVLGDYKIQCIAASGNNSGEVGFNLAIIDELSMVMTVYNASGISIEEPNCPRATDATIKLYSDSASVQNGSYLRSTATDSTGVVKFYHLKPGMYYFLVESGDLSNITQKKDISGIKTGFATVRIERSRLVCRDQNGDGELTDADRVMADILVLYENIVSERIIYISN